MINPAQAIAALRHAEAAALEAVNRIRLILEGDGTEDDEDDEDEDDDDDDAEVRAPKAIDVALDLLNAHAQLVTATSLLRQLIEKVDPESEIMKSLEQPLTRAVIAKLEKRLPDLQP